MAITPDQANTLVEKLLGPVRGPRWSVSEPAELREAIRRGLPYAALERCRDLLGMPLDELAALLGVAPRTLARRRQARRLSPEESDRLYRIAHALGQAAATLGSLERAREWMRRPNRALGGVTPVSLLDTEIGVRSVEEALGRLGHGIHS